LDFQNQNWGNVSISPVDLGHVLFYVQAGIGGEVRSLGETRTYVRGTEEGSHSFGDIWSRRESDVSQGLAKWEPGVKGVKETPRKKIT